MPLDGTAHNVPCRLEGYTGGAKPYRNALISKKNYQILFTGMSLAGCCIFYKKKSTTITSSSTSEYNQVKHRVLLKKMVPILQLSYLTKCSLVLLANSSGSRKHMERSHLIALSDTWLSHLCSSI